MGVVVQCLLAQALCSSPRQRAPPTQEYVPKVDRRSAGDRMPCGESSQLFSCNSRQSYPRIDQDPVPLLACPRCSPVYGVYLIRCKMWLQRGFRVLQRVDFGDI